jgi:hypothetical protein
VLANAPKRVSHENGSHAAGHEPDGGEDVVSIGAHEQSSPGEEPRASVHPAVPVPPADEPAPADDQSDDGIDEDRDEQDGPIHRRLIRASLPRPEGQQPPARPIPEFTIRQPGGRPNRFRPRHQRGGQPFGAGGNRSNGNMHGGPPRGMRPGGGGRPPQGGGPPRPSGRRHGPGGRKRSK